MTTSEPGIEMNGESHPFINGRDKQGAASLTVLRIALGVISANLLCYLTATGAFALFGYAILYPDVKRITAAALFTALVFVPAMWRRKL